MIWWISINRIINRRRIKKIALMSEDELLGNLFTEIIGEPYGGDSFLGSGIYYSLTQRLVSVLWLSDNFEALYNAICVKFRYCEKREDQRFSDILSLSSGVADIISTLSLGVPPFNISVLLVKLGLDKVCSCEKGDTSRRWIDGLVTTWIAKASGKSPEHETYFDTQFYRAWVWLGLKYLQEGKIEKGKREVQKAFEFGGEAAEQDATLWNSYAWNLIQANSPHEAIEPARYAIHLEPADAAYWNTLGWALFKAGHLDESIKTLEKAVEYDECCSGYRWYEEEGQVEIRYHLINAYIANKSHVLAANIVKDMEKIRPRSLWTLKAKRLLIQKSNRR